MGYDFHITRADHSWESAQYPISRAEWAEVARGHPEIELFPTGGAGSLTSGDGSFAWFTWCNGQLTTKFSQSLTAWMVHLARELGARLVGDDSEEYFEDGSHLDWESPRPPLFVRPLRPDESAAAIESLIDLPYLWPESDPIETYTHPSHVQQAGPAGAEARAAWFDGIRHLPYLAEFTGSGGPEIRFHDRGHDHDHGDAGAAG